MSPFRFWWLGKPAFALALRIALGVFRRALREFIEVGGDSLQYADDASRVEDNVFRL